MFPDLPYFVVVGKLCERRRITYTGSSSIENFTPLEGYLLCLVGDNLPKPVPACGRRKFILLKDLDLWHQTFSPCVSWVGLGGAGWSLGLLLHMLHTESNHIPEVFGDGLGTRLGERDIFPQLLINSPFTRWTGCHGNGYIPIQQTSDLSSILFLEIHAKMVMLHQN